jgi:hypothetical protein
VTRHVGIHISSSKDRRRSGVPHLAVLGRLDLANLSLGGRGEALVVGIVALGPLGYFPLDLDAANLVSTTLLLEASQPRMLDYVLEPGRATHPWLRARDGVGRTVVGGSGAGACRRVFVAALAVGEEAQLGQQALVVVQQTTHGQRDVLGVVAGALVPRRQRGAAESAEDAAVVGRKGRGKRPLDARPCLVGELGKCGRRVPLKGHAEPERERAGCVESCRQCQSIIQSRPQRDLRDADVLS